MYRFNLLINVILSFQIIILISFFIGCSKRDSFRDENAAIELYNLSTDIGEQYNVAAAHPKIINVKQIFEQASVPDPPYFPYVADSVAKLHTFDIHSPEQLKDFFRYTKDRLPLVSSHRGAAGLGYPENSIATFRHTLRHTWSIMEVDPRYTKDSVIVLMHDATLDRTSTGHGKVIDQTWAELKQLNLKDKRGNMTKFKIPTLGEALEWAKGKTVLLLDHKNVSAATRAKAIKKHHAEACAMVICYTYKAAKKVYQIDEDIMMEVFIPNRKKAKKFAKTGVPWQNVVAFISQYKPKDPGIFKYLHSRGVMTIRASERTIDKQFIQGKISEKQLKDGYRKMIQSGTDIIEANIGIRAGKTLRKMWPDHSSKLDYFEY